MLGKHKRHREQTYGFVERYFGDSGEWNATETVQTVENGKCPLSESINVYMDAEVWSKIHGLTRLIKGEWIGYLLGNTDDEGVHVTGLHIPEQFAGSSTCESLEGDPPKGTVGWVHSHDTMGVFYSGTDQTTNKQHGVSLVINKDGEYKIGATVLLPCKSKLHVEARLHLTTNFNSDQWAETVKGKVLTKDQFKESCMYAKTPDKCHWKNRQSCPFYWNECPHAKNSNGGAPNTITRNGETCIADHGLEEGMDGLFGSPYGIRIPVEGEDWDSGMIEKVGRQDSLVEAGLGCYSAEPIDGCVPLCEYCDDLLKKDAEKHLWHCKNCGVWFDTPVWILEEEFKEYAHIGGIDIEDKTENNVWETEATKRPLKQMLAAPSE